MSGALDGGADLASTLAGLADGPLDPVLGFAWLGIVVLGQATAAAIAGPATWRKALAACIPLIPAALALAHPAGQPFQRGVLWLVIALFGMRTVDVLSEAHRPLPFRLALALLAFDPRDLRPLPTARSGGPGSGGAAADGAGGAVEADRAGGARGSAAAGAGGASGPGPRVRDALLRWLGFSALFILTLGAEVPLRAGQPPLGLATLPRYALEWLLAATATYSFMDSLGAVATLAFHSVGFQVQPFQRDPILARTLGEFWGRRWNREVGRWLHRWCFVPLARRRHPELGVAAAFVFSGLFHGVSAFAALGVPTGLVMTSFFLVQGLLVALERALGVPRWRPVAAHVWTIGTFVLTMPLFVEPALRMIGI